MDEVRDDGTWAEDTAGWWQREFTDGVDPEYVEQILPIIEDQLAAVIARGGTVLDVGTGEGQVARMLAAGGAGSGARIIGVDPIEAMVAEAALRGGGVHVARAEAARLPIDAEAIDAAVACLVFEHIDAVDQAITEVARVLKPGGTFLFLLNHPLLQTPGSGWIDDQIIDPPEQYWRIGPYLTEQATVEEVQKDVFIRFIHRPLSRYLNALRAAGLVLDEMVEPAPPPGFLAQAPHYVDAATVPRLLVLRLTKV